ncbi:MAG: hypothetical protein QOG52_2333 [Frankiaceae bacterium]|jgi:hypothetical protein|nr:hypothetical protein [Frankiaceae bacterium]
MPDLDKLLGDIASSAGGGRGLLPGSALRVRAAQRRRRHAITTGVAASLVAVVAVVAVQAARSPRTPPVSAAASDAASAVAESGTGPQSGYVDFVELNGVSYLSTAQFLTDDSFVGARLGVVRRATAQAAPAGEAVAAFLPVGSEVATFTGYKPTFRVVARAQQGWKVYEAQGTLGSTGADVLDIADRVTRIDVLSAESHGALVRGSIGDSSTVTAIVSALLASRVIGSDGAAPSSYVAFAMTDGTRVIRPYNAASHRLGGIEVPAAAADALAAASR